MTLFGGFWPDSALSRRIGRRFCALRCRFLTILTKIASASVQIDHDFVNGPESASQIVIRLYQDACAGSGPVCCSGLRLCAPSAKFSHRLRRPVAGRRRMGRRRSRHWRRRSSRHRASGPCRAKMPCCARRPRIASRFAAATGRRLQELRQRSAFTPAAKRTGSRPMRPRKPFSGGSGPQLPPPACTLGNDFANGPKSALQIVICLY